MQVSVNGSVLCRAALADSTVFLAVEANKTPSVARVAGPAWHDVSLLESSSPLRYTATGLVLTHKALPWASPAAVVHALFRPFTSLAPAHRIRQVLVP